jgi:hypothetical protein
METKVTAYHLNGQYDAEVEVDILNGIYTIKLNIDQQEAVRKGVTVFDALLQIHLINGTSRMAYRRERFTCRHRKCY